MRRLPVLALLLVAGCGGDEVAQPFEPRAHDVEWNEIAEHDGRAVFEFDVSEIRYDGLRWHVRASITNRTHVPFSIDAPRNLPQGSDPRWTWLGITTSTGAAPPPGAPKILHADTYAPPLPRRLAPAGSWEGTFSGPGSPQPGTYLRVTFGMFQPHGSFPAELTPFGWVTDRVLKL